MLYLDLRLDQTILLTLPSDQVARVVLCRVKGSQVHLGVQADRDIPVDRWEARHREREA